MGFFYDHRYVLVVYAAIILLIYVNRKKFDMHGIIALYRTKIGLRLMDSWAEKYREIIKLLGYIGIGASYIGLVVISVVLLKNLGDLFFTVGAQSAVSPVLPGIKIPGTAVQIPLVSGWLALFVVIVVHEFAHGVVARAHKLKVKSSGIFFLGPIMGAFVEPDEKELAKVDDVKQYSVLAAGPFSNMLLAGAVVMLLMFVITPVQGLLVHSNGVTMETVLDDFPAYSSGIKAGMVVTSVNGVSVKNVNDFIDALQDVKAGEMISMVANTKEFVVKTTTNPKDGKSAYLGITVASHIVGNFKNGEFIFNIWKVIANFLSLTGALSLGIGLINLFPIFITDGARMLQISFGRISQKKGIGVWKKVNIFCLLVLLLSLFFPLIKFIF
jgi:membrane-associated protease RseP (regulator of RpoE activity)